MRLTIALNCFTSRAAPEASTSPSAATASGLLRSSGNEPSAARSSPMSRVPPPSLSKRRKTAPIVSGCGGGAAAAAFSCFTSALNCLMSRETAPIASIPSSCAFTFGLLTGMPTSPSAGFNSPMSSVPPPSTSRRRKTAPIVSPVPVPAAPAATIEVDIIAAWKAGLSAPAAPLYSLISALLRARNSAIDSSRP